jgi:hypothetical protein
VPIAARDAGLIPGLEGPAEWAVFALVGLLVTALVFLVGAFVAKYAYWLLRAVGARIGWVAAKLPVSDRRVRTVVVAFLAFGAVAFVGMEVRDNTTSLWDSESGAAGRANDLKEQGLNGDPVGSLDADAILTGDTYSGPPYDRPTPDTDGDRLKDSWERAGVTPWGAQLPGADPEHKDLYVQVNYGANVSAYTAAEKRALERVWARMPVDNPDGEQGIRLHFVEGERLSGTPTFDPSSGDDLVRFYDRDHMGPRTCVYHQVVVGRVTAGDAVGVANVPGYVSVVDGRRTAFEGNTTRRVHVTTHELLHNTVGTVEGSGHTSRGWLSPTVTPEDDFLSPSAEAALDERIAGSGYFQHEVCSRGTPTPGS